MLLASIHGVRILLALLLIVLLASVLEYCQGSSGSLYLFYNLKKCLSIVVATELDIVSGFTLGAQLPYLSSNLPRGATVKSISNADLHHISQVIVALFLWGDLVCSAA